MTSEHPAPYDLERYVGAAMSAEESHTLVQHLSQCVSCQAIVQQRQQEREELLQKRNPALFAMMIEQRVREGTHRSRRTSSWLWLSVGGLTAAAMLILLVVRASIENTSRPADEAPHSTEAVRWMGDQVTAMAYVQRGPEQMRLAADHAPQAGDRLHFELQYTGLPALHVAVFAMQGATVTQVIPAAGAKPLQLGPTTSNVLPQSVVTDQDSSGMRILLVARPKPFRLEDVAQQLRSAARSGRWSAVPGIVYNQIVAGPAKP